VATDELLIECARESRDDVKPSDGLLCYFLLPDFVADFLFDPIDLSDNFLSLVVHHLVLILQLSVVLLQFFSLFCKQSIL
jgi:hypothetical protein